jgi:hypothetical protein|tara:strand:- start:3120 stop:3614 length:495 start_codon:yes stop_codon:yes gene_type:complete
MKASSLKDIKADLKNSSKDELLELTLRLIRFKKDNKELITYLLYESDNDDLFIESCKSDMNESFAQINRSSFFFIRKAIRKILSLTKKNIRYAQKKNIEIELLLHFCKLLTEFRPKISRNKVLMNTLETQTRMLRKSISTMNEDLQHDYTVLLEEILEGFQEKG